MYSWNALRQRHEFHLRASHGARKPEPPERKPYKRLRDRLKKIARRHARTLQARHEAGEGCPDNSAYGWRVKHAEADEPRRDFCKAQQKGTR